MKVPKSIKVNGISYAIIMRPDFAFKEDVGTCYSWKQEIHLNEDAAPAQMASTLLHELLHAISHQYLEGDNDLNETQVTGLTAGLFNVLTNCGINLIDLVNEGLE